MSRKCQARDPRRCRCTKLRTVRCPSCRRVYLALIPWLWSVRALRRTYDYPPLKCRSCQASEDYARAHGGRPEDWAYPERAPD